MKNKILAAKNSVEEDLHLVQHAAAMLRDRFNIFGSKKANKLLAAMLRLKTSGYSLRELFREVPGFEFLKADRMPKEQSQIRVYRCLNDLCFDNVAKVKEILTNTVTEIFTAENQARILLKQNLLKAVNENDLLTVWELLQQGAAPDGEDMYGGAAFEIAARKNHFNIAGLLLQARSGDLSAEPPRWKQLVCDQKNYTDFLGQLHQNSWQGDGTEQTPFMPALANDSDKFTGQFLSTFSLAAAKYKKHIWVKSAGSLFVFFPYYDASIKVDYQIYRQLRDNPNDSKKICQLLNWLGSGQLSDDFKYATKDAEVFSLKQYCLLLAVLRNSNSVHFQTPNQSGYEASYTGSVGWRYSRG